MDLLEARGIGKHYAGVHALSEVHFSAKAGEVHAVLGENGAGKAPSFRLWGCRHSWSAGTLFLRGSALRTGNPAAAEAAGVAAVFQEFSLIPDLNVAENIWFVARSGRPWDSQRPGSGGRNDASVRDTRPFRYLSKPAGPQPIRSSAATRRNREGPRCRPRYIDPRRGELRSAAPRSHLAAADCDSSRQSWEAGPVYLAPDNGGASGCESKSRSFAMAGWSAPARPETSLTTRSSR